VAAVVCHPEAQRLVEGQNPPVSESPNAMLQRAIEVAVVCHAGHVDKSGEAYILHPLRVMLAVRESGGSMEQQAAAVLHDVIEDCGVKDEFLLARFPIEVCDLVDALTKIKGEDYEEFLRRVALTTGALLIKEADIRDNHGRLHLLRDLDVKDRLQRKYDNALKVLAELREKQ
jgi:(p)ppGpp synthase/HD superfamily hydrolase